MPEILQPPSEGHIAIMQSYFAEVPRLSADDYTFDGRISEVIWSLKASELLSKGEEEMRCILEIPIDLVRDIDKFNNNEIGMMVYEFAQELAILLGKAVIDKRASLGNYSARFDLLKTAHQAVTHLMMRYALSCDNFLSPPYIFVANLHKVFEEGIFLSIRDAAQFASSYIASDDEALMRAIFLADAAKAGYCSAREAHALQLAWAATRYKTLINPGSSLNPLHKPEN